MDDPGRSALGELFRSPLGDLRRVVAPTQMRIGNDFEQRVIAGPVDMGTSLAFFIETYDSTANTIFGIMFVAYDFSEIISFQVISGTTFFGSVNQVQMVGAYARSTYNDFNNGLAETLDVPLTGSIKRFTPTADLQIAIYNNASGNYAGRINGYQARFQVLAYTTHLELA